MKRIIIMAALCFAVAACAEKQVCQFIPAENFNGEVDGVPVALYTLQNGGITLQATNFGGRVVSIYVPDNKGNLVDVVAGKNTLDEYANPTGERFLGACVGPVANRIGGAHFEIDGVGYDTPKNDNKKNTLHGGFKGVDMLAWDFVSSNDTSVVFHLLHPDGLEGYPGNIDMTMTYSLTSKGEFVINYLATTDKPTHINFSNHPFFNLSGEGVGSVEDYVMSINADYYVPIDKLSIPTGGCTPVEGTPFDFRKAHTIGQMIGEDDEQLKNAKGYDHNWCINLNESGLNEACTVYNPANGIFLEVFTDQPGLQFYSGNFFNGKHCGKNGNPLGFRSSLALETQHYPDTPNHPEFPSTLVNPGEEYTHVCIYKFSTK